MPHPNRPPSALRIARPYASEKEFVEGDFAFLGRATLFLPNVTARPAGELVRFEFVLASAVPVFRGEAQVVSHHAATGVRPEGLEVRITRMDAKSKAILDHVKERRAAGVRTGSKSLTPEKRGETIAPKGAPSPVEAAPPVPSSAVAAPSPPLSVLPPVAPRPAPDPARDTPSETSGIHLRPIRLKVAPPPNREEILDRLRERARQLAAKGVLPPKRAHKQSA